MHFGMCIGHIDAIPLSDCHCTLPASERTLPQSSSSLPSSRRVRVRRVRRPTHPQCSARPQKRRHALLLPLLFIRLSNSTEGGIERDGFRRGLAVFARPGLIAGKENVTILKSEAQRIFRPFSIPPLRLSFNFHRDRGREGRRGMGAANAKEGGTGARGRTRQDCRVVRTLQGDSRHSSEVA